VVMRPPLAIRGQNLDGRSLPVGFDLRSFADPNSLRAWNRSWSLPQRSSLWDSGVLKGDDQPTRIRMWMSSRGVVQPVLRSPKSILLAASTIRGSSIWAWYVLMMSL